MKTLLRAVALVGLGAVFLSACRAEAPDPAAEGGDTSSAAATADMVLDPAAFWNSATVYFLLTDRFYDADTTNDLALGRGPDGAGQRR